MLSRCRCVLALVVIIAVMNSCLGSSMSTGLRGEPFGEGYYGTTVLALDQADHALVFKGEISVSTGELKVMLISPSSTIVRSYVIKAGETKLIDDRVEPMVGQWHVVAESVAGTGNFTLELGY